jgi:hypothetical protein
LKRAYLNFIISKERILNPARCIVPLFKERETRVRCELQHLLPSSLRRRVSDCKL